MNLSACVKIIGDDLCSTIAQTQPNLRSLELWRLPGVTSTGVFELSKLPNLEELDLGWCRQVNAQTGCIVQIVTNCVKLVKLVLTAQRQTSDQELAAMAGNLPHLEQLDVMGTRHVTPSGVKALLNSAEKLKMLDIGYCELLEDGDTLKALKSDFPKCQIVHTFL